MPSAVSLQPPVSWDPLSPGFIKYVVCGSFSFALLVILCMCVRGGNYTATISSILDCALLDRTHAVHGAKVPTRWLHFLTQDILPRWPPEVCFHIASIFLGVFLTLSVCFRIYLLIFSLHFFLFIIAKESTPTPLLSLFMCSFLGEAGICFCFFFYIAFFVGKTMRFNPFLKHFPGTFLNHLHLISSSVK